MAKKLHSQINIATPTPKRIFYFDYLRIVAIIAIVTLHSASQNWYTTDISSPEWNAFNIYDSLMRWGVPIFVMISGALFLNKEQSIEKIYRKNILKILIILILWTTIYTLWQFFITNEQLSFKELIIKLLIGPYYLWFLYMLIGLYMIVPFFSKIRNNKKLLKYFLLLAFVFAFLIPELTKIIALQSETTAQIIEDKLGKMKFFFALGFSGYFILGHFLNQKIIKRKTELILYSAGIIGAISTIIFTLLLSKATGKADPFFYGEMTINVATMSIAVFVFFKKHLQSECRNPRIRKLLHLLSRNSLGVYLIHVLVLDSLNVLFGINSLSFNPIVSVPLLSFFVLLISYPLSIMLYKIPVIGKWIV